MSMLTNDWSLALKDEFNKPYYRDLYRFVKEEYRGLGIGKALIGHLASIALERGCGRLEWWCLD